MTRAEAIRTAEEHLAARPHIRVKGEPRVRHCPAGTQIARNKPNDLWVVAYKYDDPNLEWSTMDEYVMVIDAGTNEVAVPRLA